MQENKKQFKNIKQMEEVKEVNLELDKSKEKRKEIIQIIFLILLILAIAALIYSAITILRYNSMLSNPLGYSLNKFGIDSCICMKDGQQMIIKSINST